MAEPQRRVVGCDDGGGGHLVLGLPMLAYGGAILLAFFWFPPKDFEVAGPGMAVLTATCAVYFGGMAVRGGVSRIRSGRVLRRRPGVWWARRCCEVERPGVRVLVVEEEGVSLLSQRGESVRSWAWSELGGATVDRLVVAARDWEALVLWSPDEHRLAQLGFPGEESVFVERMGFSAVGPGEARAVILDRLQQYESRS